MSLRAAYCVFPSSEKEYVYLCPFEWAKVGDHANVTNGGRVKILRLSSNIPKLATKTLTGIWTAPPENRKAEIISRLNEIERLELLAERFKRLKSPEAKKLITEYKRLCK